MLTITGTVKEIERAKVLPPDDGVHRASTKTGYLKGVRCFMLNGKLMPKGQTGFYHRYKPDFGLKVFYKVDNEGCHRAGRKAVMKEWRNRQKLTPYNVIPKSTKVVKVKLDLKYGKRRIQTWAYAIKVAHVHYPKAAWETYAKGYPYDWDAVDHPKHTPDGYKAFADKVYAACKKTGVTVCGGDKRPKLGDIVWCTKRKRWYQVDCA
jgi:hypothetical protein